MAKLGTVEQSTGGDTKVVSGLYLLRLESCEDVGISEMYPDSGPQWLWKWKVVRSLEAEPDEEQEASVGEVIHEYTKSWIGFTKNGAKSKPLARADALMKVDTPKPDEGETTDPPVEDTDELIGKTLKAAVEVSYNTKGNLRAKLVSVAPYKSKTTEKPAKPARPAPPPPDDEDDEDDDLPF